MARETQETDWTAVIARTLAFLSIHQADLQKETLVKQADFLERFGIPRSEAAVIVGSSDRSLKEMERQQKSRAAKKSTAKKSTAKRPSARKSAAKRSTAKRASG
jgi:DNA-binding protein HU-beta